MFCTTTPLSVNTETQTVFTVASLPTFHLLFLFSLFQIGAYDQQIWEKSVEQREIKVCLLHCLLASSLHISVLSLLHFHFSIFVFCFFKMSLWLSLLCCPLVSLFFFCFQCLSPCCQFFSSVFLLTLCSLPSRLGVICLSLPFPPPSLSFFSSSSLQFISLVSNSIGGHPFCCPHSARQPTL